MDDVLEYLVEVYSACPFVTRLRSDFCVICLRYYTMVICKALLF